MLPIDQFRAFIKQHQLFNADDLILLAVSGGKDSALMVQLFKQAGFNFGIAHCNFNLRGAEAQRDEAFVRLLAEEVAAPVHVIQFDTAAFASQEKISIQMAARQLRYQWFEQLRLEHSYSYIALAHHQNDSIETLLLNLVRGTGIAGMHGILPKRNKLVRPLIFLSRQEIDTLIEENSIAYVEDSSNASSKYARNKIRLKVIPQLREINPNLEETFAANIKRFAETELLLQDVVRQKSAALLNKVNHAFEIAISQVQALKPQKLLLFEILKPFGFSSAVVDDLLTSLAKQSGTTFTSLNYQLIIDREKLIITKKNGSTTPTLYMQEESVTALDDGRKINFFVTNSVQFSSNNKMAYVDANLLRFPLSIRFWQDGDRFKPLGMQNFKKLSDFFIDSKIPVPQKHAVPLLFNGDGKLIWVIGLRQDERFKVTEATKKVAIFELLNG